MTKSLNRKLRPQKFSELVGHNVFSQILTTAIRLKQAPTAVLFYGPSGVGKTTLARIFAKALICESIAENSDPCGNCELCILAQGGCCPDIIEMDAASKSSVENIRELIDSVSFAPLKAKKKIYIIDEVHMLSTAAFNALLLTLEEAPSHVHFAFATTEYHKVPTTVAARCLVFNLKRLSIIDIRKHLRSVIEIMGISIGEESIEIIARLAEGSVRDAITILEKCIVFCGPKIEFNVAKEILGILAHDTYESLLMAIMGLNTEKALSLMEEIYSGNIGLDAFFSYFLGVLTDCAIYKMTRAAPENFTDQLLQALADIDARTLEAIWHVFFTAKKNLLIGSYSDNLNLIKITILKAILVASDGSQDQSTKNLAIEKLPKMSGAHKTSLSSNTHWQSPGITLLASDEGKDPEIILVSSTNSEAGSAENLVVEKPVVPFNHKASIDSSNKGQITLSIPESPSPLESFLAHLKSINELNLYSVLKTNISILNFAEQEIRPSSRLPQRYTKHLLQIIRNFAGNGWKIIRINEFSRTMEVGSEIMIPEIGHGHEVGEGEDDVDNSRILPLTTQQKEFFSSEIYTKLKNEFDITEKNVIISG